MEQQGSKRGLLRRFAPRNDDKNAASRSRRGFRAKFACSFRPHFRGRRECRTLGASAAACAVVESTRVSHHGHAGSSGIPRAMVLTVSFALSPVTGLVCHRRLRKLVFAHLMPASGHQDHTTSPSASAPLVLRRCRVHRIPHPTFVTTAKRPSDRGGTGRVCRDDLPDGESGIFFMEGLDSQSRNQPVGQITAPFSRGAPELTAALSPANSNELARSAPAGSAARRRGLFQSETRSRTARGPLE
ncbi:MAG: hypothetical protein E8A46_10225 [Bradyrhizobium sp.]|nr:MAG: hypothetical protein E8A46_10225 [Bradyrhizobium sp.]